MSSKTKSVDGSKSKGESPWKRAFVANAEWPDKVRLCTRELYHETFSLFVYENVHKNVFNHILNFQEEFLDVIYWMRQAMGIILGLFWGLLPLKGFLGLLLYVLIC